MFLRTAENRCELMK